ncbi:MAG: family phosphatase [Rhizorhabdus sp.]|nr:family phosphatase [Rhizorhabdus sp.]
MAEPVRLVIWDLDDTFWRGTVTEGGITEYVQAHHDIVIELAHRGIMSSICSKNDADTILNILREREILDYSIFPSINWEPKGTRLAALIEAVSLRPATVMFIDDNPGNRGEAARMVPGLQIEDEHFVARLLDDPRFGGKDDAQLTRLAQYKLLETRKKDEQQASGDNAEFLRSCDVCVYIEYDVMQHLDRAIELINRTNQLNFTKKRLPEDMDEARRILAEGVNNRWRQCGLVHVADKYGDYGFVGFFMVENGVMDAAGARLAQKIIHYCFSCRTLGMHVERWLYDRLQRPQIKVSGEVLTDLNDPRPVDWIRMASSIDEKTVHATAAPEIRIHGGCEAASVAHYLGAHSDKVVATGNFNAGTQFVRLNGVSLLLSACDRRNEHFQREAAALRIPYGMLISQYFDDVPEGTIFIFGCQHDKPGATRYRHKVYGWELGISGPRTKGQGIGPDVTKVSSAQLADFIATAGFPPQSIEAISSVSWHLHRNYESVAGPDEQKLTADLKDLLGRIPAKSRIVFMLDHHVVRSAEGKLVSMAGTDRFNEKLKDLLKPYPFAGTACFTDAILHEDEIQIGGNHYDRMVYCRMAEKIMDVAQDLPLKSSPPAKEALADTADFTLAPRLAGSTAFTPFADTPLHRPVTFTDLMCGPAADLARLAAG